MRAEIDRRKRRLGILSYDDLLSRLADALRPTTRPPGSGCAQRWRIVLVDEFQDTDPVQWEVLDRAFTGHATLVLIGDPKQAIYAFRGGDIFTYLARRRDRRHPRTLAATGAATRPSSAGLGDRPGGRHRPAERPRGDQGDQDRLTVASLGDSSTLAVGDPVVAIG